MNTTAGLRGWTERGIHTVTLPTGMIVRVRLPSVEHLLRKGVFPDELVGMAVRFTMERVVVRDLNEEDRNRFLRMKDELIAYCVQEQLVEGSGAPDDPENKWEPLDLRPYLLDLSVVIPSEDLDALGMIAIRYKSPLAVSAESRAMLRVMAALDGRVTEEHETPEREGEAAPTAGEFPRVDNDADGAPDSADGEGVRQESGARLSRARSGARSADRPGALRQTREG